MVKFQKVRRLTIICSSHLEQDILNHLTQLGAKGYTVVTCFGAGEHFYLEDPLRGHEGTRIETLLAESALEKVLEYLLENPDFENQPLFYYCDNVEVLEGTRI